MNPASNASKTIKLSEVLRLAIDPVSVEPTSSYPMAGVYSFGRGLFSREPLTGAGTTYKVLHVLHADDFVLSQLKAWEGALARVSAEFDGWHLSPQFPTFRVNADRLDIGYLEWYCKLPEVWEKLRSAARGMGARRDSVSPERFLRLDISLPPLIEQRRIVSRIEALAAKITEATEIQKEITKEMDAVCRALIINPADGELSPTGLSELLVMREADVKVEATKSYHFAGVYCFGRGVFAGQRKDGSEFAYRSLTRIHKDNFIYPKLMAWEGALGIVPENCDGLYVSPEFPVFEVRQDRVLPEVLDTYFRMPAVWPDLAGISTGTNVRRRRLHPKAFLQYKFPLPSMKAQHQLCVVKRSIEQAKLDQRESAVELTALMPSILSKAFRGEL